MHNMSPRYGGEPDHQSASKFTGDQAQAATPAMKVESVSIRPTANGGYVVTCNKVQEKPSGKGLNGRTETKEYAFASFAEAADFIATEFGQQTSAVPPEPEAPLPEAPLPSALPSDVPASDEEFV